MAGFLTDGAITLIRSRFDTLHETFARDITVYKTNKQEVIIATDSKYNPIYGRTSAGSRVEQETTISSNFKARIYYVKSEEDEITDAQDNVNLPIGSVKIIVDQTAYEYIREANNVTFDGNKFSISTHANPYGMTANQFFVFYLAPINEN